MIALNFIDPTDGRELSQSEVLGYLKPGLSDGPVATAEEFAETLSEVPDDCPTPDAGEAGESAINPGRIPDSLGEQNNTLVRSSTEQSGETELTDIGGLSRGERHSISGVTAGETALPYDGSLSDEQLNFKLARLVGWKFRNHDWNSAWHDELGDGPPMDYCKVFGQKLIAKIFAGLAQESLSKKP